jgi:hypothetical protein
MHSPASSNKLKPPKFKTQITLAIEPVHMATSSTEITICLMITPPHIPTSRDTQRAGLGGAPDNTGSLAAAAP